MKRLCALAFLGALAAGAHAQGQHYVRPHVTSDGTYVEGHFQTNPDGNRFNNWSTQGNMNPYTGQPGTVDPYRQPMPEPSFPRVEPASPMVMPMQQCGYTATGRYVCR